MTDKNEQGAMPAGAGPMGLTPDIAAAVCKVMSQVRKIGKGDTNKFDNYKFASVDAFFEFVNPLCADAGLFVLHQEREYEYYENKKGSLWMRVFFDFYICHSGGSVCGPFNRQVAVPMTGAQSFGSAQSYALKQFLRATFLIPTGDNDDADHASKDEHQSTPKRDASTPPKPPAPPDEKAALTEIGNAASFDALKTVWGNLYRAYFKAGVDIPKTVEDAKEAKKNELSGNATLPSDDMTPDGAPIVPDAVPGDPEDTIPY